jgi:flagellar biosynthetic protein FliQ
VNTDLALGMTQDMLLTSALIAAPILGIALLVGLLISIIQVVTQIQEMTLTFVPKIVAIVVVLFVLGPWMLTQLTEYASGLYKSIPTHF